jgi:aminoglycoside 3-N-acetyltransferase
MAVTVPAVDDRITGPSLFSAYPPRGPVVRIHKIPKTTNQFPRMSEADAVDAVDDPLTTSSLASGLRDLGIEAGDTLLVHCSLGELGWVCGGPQAVVDALQEVLTESGTLVMPTHSAQYSNPVHWENPPVPDHWVDIIREEMPPYRPESTPTRGIGAVAECFRDYPDVHRSRHPEVSFAAWGTDAEAVVADHTYDFGLGEGSPLARVYDHDGDVLMLGTDWSTCTSLHLSEYRADYEAGRVENAAPVLADGERVLVEYEDIAIDDDDFPDIGRAFEGEFGVTRGDVGAGEATLVNQPAIVDFGVEWMSEHR